MFHASHSSAPALSCGRMPTLESWSIPAILSGVTGITENNSDLICPISNEDQIGLSSRQASGPPSEFDRKSSLPAKGSFREFAYRNFLLSFYFLCGLRWPPVRNPARFVTGTVHDKSGALIPWAQVTLRQAETGAPLSAMVDAEGNFHIPVNSLVTYQLEVQSMGFKTYTATDRSHRARDCRKPIHRSRNGRQYANGRSDSRRACC